MRMVRAPMRVAKKHLPVIVVSTSLFVLVTISVLSTNIGDSECIDSLQKRLAQVQDRLELMKSLYRSVQLELHFVQGRLTNSSWFSKACTNTTASQFENKEYADHILAGFNVCNESSVFDTAYVYQFLPHLLEDPHSTRPLYSLHAGNRSYPVEYVIGIPTVKRNKGSYLTITLSHLITAMDSSDQKDVLIIVMIGETDRDYILSIANQIDKLFARYLASGLIRILAPSAGYYPHLDLMRPTLDDPAERFRWRTKQNLDAIFLMSYALDKATYYLMLEDDVIAKRGYLAEIRHFTSKQTQDNPNWVMIEYCSTGGIGKLFRSSALRDFMIYLQLFHANMPIDWLTESYLSDRICTIDKTSKACGERKLLIRPKYSRSLFEHIGIYSSLKGKTHLPGKHNQPRYYAHNNPRVKKILSSLTPYKEHTLEKVYEGTDFFWANQIKVDDYFELVFEQPIYIERYLIRSGNTGHIHDILYGAIVKVLPLGGNYTVIGKFNSFGMVEGRVEVELGTISSLRVEVTEVSKQKYWIIISEIEIVPLTNPS